MISVSSEIGLGYGGIEEDINIMEEESDFDEESTHSFVSCVDPDVALSYIDEKLENVLGHFQKDFEGGVSAENLGAKFGGYGSFLSMYQRSPACARLKSPQEVQNHVVGRADVSVSGSTSKAPDVLGKLKKFVKSSNIGTPESKQRCVSDPSNPKTLRLRIKVGSSDMSSLKNVCKQGVDMPPSGVEEGLLYGIHDSPTKIIMAMVSFPLRSDQLLSPLSDDLMYFGKKDYVSVNKSDLGKQDIFGVCDAQKSAGKDKLNERVKYRPQSNRREGNHIFGSNSEKDADERSCEELVSKTMKLPLLSCQSPSYIHPAKEIDQISGMKLEREDNVVAFPVRSVKKAESVDIRKEGERRVSLESKSTREKAPSIEHVDNSPVDKISQSETRNEEQASKSKRPKMSQKSSGTIVPTNSLRGKDAAVNIISTNVPEKLQEDMGGSKDVYEDFFGDSGESKEKKQSNPVLNSKKEMVSEENVLKESVNSVKKDEDRHSTKESVTWEGKNKHSVEGEMENLRVEPERELSGTSKKPKTGRSRFSAVDQPRFKKHVDALNKSKDSTKASSHDRHDDRKRKQNENKESEDQDRKQKRHKGSSYDRERAVSQEDGRDSASHLPFTASCAKGSVEESVAPSALRVLDPPELKSRRMPERDEHHNGGDKLKRCRDGKGYSTIDKPGTTKKAAGITKEDNLLITGQATHSWDKERAHSENRSSENYKPKKSGRYSDENGTDGESQRKNKEDDRGMVNEVQDLGTRVEVKTKESRSKKIPMESSKKESREYPGPSTKLDRNGNHFPSPQKSDRSKTFRGKGNHVDVTADKLKSKAPPSDTEQVTKKPQCDKDSVTGSRNQKQNGSRYKDHVDLSPLKKESQSQAASNLIKEAADLKHVADRLQGDGSDHERTGVYFQAVLKFLHGASLLESNSGSRQVYGRTANLCEFCAHEYEKHKDMGAAALAYKCLEVAYLRIAYSSHGFINRYRHDLQAALQVNSSGESPSLASDGENSNHTSATENHVISSAKTSSLSQLLAFSQGVSFAMDASRKAQVAFAAAKRLSSDTTQYNSDGITCIKRALDFNFQDIEKFLHLVRLAIESINR